MNISKQSWHYKVVSNFSGYAPEDFCAYSRTLLLALITLFVLAFGVLIIIPGILGLFVNDILKYLDTIYINTESVTNPFLTWLFVIGIGYLAILVCVPIVYYSIKMINKLSGKRSNHSKEPSIVNEWIKHKKGKYCSQLTFKD